MQFKADDGSTGEQIADFFGTVVEGALGALGNLGDSQLSQVCAKVGLKKKANPNPNPNIFDTNNLEDQLLAAAGDVLDNLIDLGENAKLLKRLTQAINN